MRVNSSGQAGRPLGNRAASARANVPERDRRRLDSALPSLRSPVDAGPVSSNDSPGLTGQGPDAGAAVALADASGLVYKV
jgi:hypothetical protein